MKTIRILTAFALLVMPLAVPAQDAYPSRAIRLVVPYAPGSVSHISAEMLRATTGIDLLHVPYKSAAQAYPDMIGGSVSMVFDALPSAIQHIRSGKVRPIAMMSDRRASLVPDVPTFAEAGY